jgi:16S rRNA (cytosine967-C5)-methyltransferase
MSVMKKQIKTARFVAIETLCHLYQNRSPVKPLFDGAVSRYSLPASERNLAMQLIYGVLRKRQSLDRILEYLSRTPLKKIDLFVHQALAVGLYQIFYLERIPESAAVNEVVESCKKAKIPKRLHGFVNGILRQAIRQKTKLTTEAQTDATGKPILNHPEWLAGRWRKNFGSQETEKICKANNCEPVLVLRVNSSIITRDDFCQSLKETEVAFRLGSYSKEAVVLPDFHGSITTVPGYTEGFFQVQDEAAQLATTLLGPFRQGGRFLDACAGLGGKTAHMFQFGKNHMLEIHAVEPEPHRLRKLKENMNRLFHEGSPIIHEGSLQEFSLQDLPPFDGILIDAPCSGTGVIGRHPDIRWNRHPEDLLRYQKIQKALVKHAATLLAPNGVLVYATCSLEPEENQDVVMEFLNSHKEFRLTDCSLQLPEAAKSLTHDNFFTPHPSETIDGFFAARMQRTQEAVLE